MPIDVNQVMQWHKMTPVEMARKIRLDGKALVGKPLKRKPPCIHRGKFIDATSCGCSVWQCQLHGTCSNNQRSGLKLCQDCSDYQPKS